MLNQPNPMPDTSLQNSLAWVHTMPKGKGLTPPILGPVVEYQTRSVTGLTSKQKTDVVEWLYAEIHSAHLDKGTDPNKALRDWVQNEVGVKADQAGHIVASRLGGVGTVKWNIFPQNGNFNTGVYRASIEDTIYKEVKRLGSLKVWYHFVYGDTAHPGRPSSFHLYFHSSLGGDHSGDLVNPVLPADAKSSK